MGPSPSRESKENSNSSSNVNIYHDKSLNPIDEVMIFEGHKDRVRLLTKINGNKIASCSDDKTAIIWNINNGQKIHLLEGHSLPITCMMSISFPSPSDVDGCFFFQVFPFIFLHYLFLLFIVNEIFLFIHFIYLFFSTNFKRKFSN